MSIDITDAFVGRKILNFFRIKQKIGAGAFAAVYLAEQEGTERLAVVKIAHPHLASDSSTKEHVFSRFGAEFKASTRVNHPHIATVYTAGRTDDGLPAIAMEYVPGLPLNVLLPKHAPVLLEATLSFVEQIGGALLSLHRAGIIHRDITPNNIVVYHDAYTQKPVYKLLDFGIAKVDDISGQTNGPIGTPRYMAPEQVNGQVHEKTDIYGLGALLWWFITGQEYLGHIKKISELFLYHLKPNPVPSPAALRPGLPIMLVQLMRSMLNPLPEQRPDLSIILEKWPKLIGNQPTSTTSWPWGQSQKDLLSVATPALTEPVRFLALAPTQPPSAPKKKVRSFLLTQNINPVSATVLSCGVKELGFESTSISTPDELFDHLSSDWDVILASSDMLQNTAWLARLRPYFHGKRRLYLLSENPRETQQKVEGLSFIDIVAPAKISHLCADIAQTHGIDSGRFKSVSKSDGSFSDTNSGMSFGSQIEIIEHFIGMMPEWLADLEEHVAVNDDIAFAMSRQVLMASSSIGADHMSRLASILGEMLKAKMHEDARGIIDELSNEYSDIFRKLLTVRNSCEQKLQDNQRQV